MSYAEGEDAYSSSYYFRNLTPDNDSFSVQQVYYQRGLAETRKFIKLLNEKPEKFAQRIRDERPLDFPDKEMNSGLIAANDVNLLYALDRLFYREAAIAPLHWYGPYLSQLIDAATVEVMFDLGLYRPTLAACRRVIKAWVVSRLATDVYKRAGRAMIARYQREFTTEFDASKQAQEAIDRARDFTQ